jgi:hypothetical protein
MTDDSPLIIFTRQLGPVSDFMVNVYCESLTSSFAQLVYYGIIDERDAQCFGVLASVEAGAFLLFTAAALLTVLNTFVSKAVYQYHRDHEEDTTIHDNADEQHDMSQLQNEIAPTPVLFTDTFRWLLCREGECGGARLEAKSLSPLNSPTLTIQESWSVSPRSEDTLEAGETITQVPADEESYVVTAHNIEGARFDRSQSE